MHEQKPTITLPTISTDQFLEILQISLTSFQAPKPVVANLAHYVMELESRV